MSDPLQHPIGYWLKRLDEQLEAAFVDTLGRFGFTRREWRVLNAVGDGATLEVLRAELRPFEGKDPGGTEHAAAILLRRGWLTDPDGTFVLSESGAAGRDRLGREVVALRQRVAAGVSEEDYATTVRTLAAMCANLERADGGGRAG